MAKKNLLSEKQYQRYIIDYLVKNNKYEERKNENLIVSLLWIENCCSSSSMQPSQTQ